MSRATNLRLATTKAVLWLFVGIASAVGIGRYTLGLGLTTALTDRTPWGLWIGFDVMAGVALAAGGFVIAAAVHVFHLERYHTLLRPAILTAFLGYVAVVLGLLVDLGRPWNIWRMTVYWQPHSALFEVGWCVMLYLTVLTLEFAPVVAEGLRRHRVLAFLRRFTLPLVIVGIALSTLHQSSLGTLMVIAPNRVHPLWYSPLLPLLFLVSAVALGLAMVAAESIVSAWLFHREAEWDLVAGLTRAASVALALYLALRLGDLGVRGQLHHLAGGTFFSWWLVLELLASTVVPLLLFTLPSARRNHRALATGALLSVLGFILYRVNAGGLSHVAATGEGYLPALTELAMSLGVVATMALVFLFFVEHLKVWEHPPEPAGHFRQPLVDPVSSVMVRAPWLGGTQRAALAWVAGGILGVALLEGQVAARSKPRPAPIAPPRAAAVTPAAVALPDAPPVALATLLLDGDGNGNGVTFAHDAHKQRLGGETTSCERCHHRNRRRDRATSCAFCHRDMYAATDTFDHARHAAATGHNDGCRRCHAGSDAAPSRDQVTPCDTCHHKERHAASGVRPASPALAGLAAPYRDAMHGLCIGCHRQEDERRGEEPKRSRCTFCHQRNGALESPLPAALALAGEAR